MYYQNVFGPKLKARFLELATVSHKEHVQLYEELVLARLVCERAVRLAAPALECDKADSEAIAQLQSAITQVRDTVLASSRVESMSRDTISLNALDLVIRQMLRIIHETLGPTNIKWAKAIEQKFDDIKLPSSEATALSPIELTAEIKKMMGSVGGVD